MSNFSPLALTDEDGEVGFLIGAPDGISEDDAIAMFVTTFFDQYGGKIVSVDADPLTAELKPFRQPREGDHLYGDAVLYPCVASETDQMSEMVWVIEGIEWR